jgi:hypothetical protein
MTKNEIRISPGLRRVRRGGKYETKYWMLDTRYLIMDKNILKTRHCEEWKGAWQSQCKNDRLLRGVYLEQKGEILHFIHNDRRRRARNYKWNTGALMLSLRGVQRRSNLTIVFIEIASGLFKTLAMTEENNRSLRGA